MQAEVVRRTGEGYRRLFDGQEGGAMPAYSIAEAKDRLSKLIREAEDGEDVAITRRGRIVAHLRPARRTTGLCQPSRELVAEIVARARMRGTGAENAVDVIRRMRDGEDN